MHLNKTKALINYKKKKKLFKTTSNIILKVLLIH